MKSQHSQKKKNLKCRRRHDGRFDKDPKRATETGQVMCQSHSGFSSPPMTGTKVYTARYSSKPVSGMQTVDSKEDKLCLPTLKMPKDRGQDWNSQTDWRSLTEKGLFLKNRNELSHSISTWMLSFWRQFTPLTKPFFLKCLHPKYSNFISRNWS